MQNRKIGIGIDYSSKVREERYYKLPDLGMRVPSKIGIGIDYRTD